MRSTTIVRAPMRHGRCCGNHCARFPVRSALRRDAFSLIEMVMVLTILSLVAAIAVPRFSGAIARRRLESAATRVTQDVSLARSHARLISGEVKISFAKKRATYSMDRVPDPNVPSTMYSVDLRGAPYHVTGWEATFEENEEVTFDMYGAPDKGGSILLRIGSEARVVLIDGDTGNTETTNDVSVIPSKIGGLSLK